MHFTIIKWSALKKINTKTHVCTVFFKALVKDGLRWQVLLEAVTSTGNAQRSASFFLDEYMNVADDWYNNNTFLVNDAVSGTYIDTSIDMLPDWARDNSAIYQIAWMGADPNIWATNNCIVDAALLRIKAARKYGSALELAALILERELPK